MNWRPKNWDNPYPDLSEEVLTEKHLIQAMEKPKSNYELFEAGADAMLEALKQLRDRVICEKDSVIIRLSPMLEEGEYKEGTWYFVPDEKEED